MILNSSDQTFVLCHAKSKREIKDDSIISSDESGITESTDSGWRFTPASEIESVIVSADGPYAVSPAPILPTCTSEEKFDSATILSATETEEVNKVTYFFGIDSVAAKRKVFNKNCGFIFKEIVIGKCSFIELSANFTENNNCSVEFSIIDGTKEIPILPVAESRVLNEKLFFNLSTRFTVDSKSPIEIKRNGLIIKRYIEDLKTIDIKDGVCTISYTPVNAYRYIPENEIISIKIVQRLYDDSSEPSYITNLLIRKYGGGVPWTA